MSGDSTTGGDRGDGPTAREGAPGAVGAGESGEGEGPRPAVAELRLSAFKSFRGTRLRLGAVSVLAGPSGAGKSNALEALLLLGRLAAGATLPEAVGAVRGGAAACVPLGTVPDGQGRRGFRIGCTVDGPVGPVHLDVAVQVEPRLRIVGERLTGAGRVLLETALRDPARRTVQAAWHTAGVVPVTRAPLPDDQLASALLPLRVAGRTAGQRLVIAGSEQLVVGLRGVFPLGPRPWAMREWAEAADGLLHTTAGNVSAVVRRTEAECRVRHGMLAAALDAVCPYPVEGITVLRDGSCRVMAALDRGSAGLVPASVMGDGELRALAYSLVLLTGPGVLSLDPVGVPDALRLLTVPADDMSRGLDRRQYRELLRLAVRMSARGHVRLVATAHEPQWPAGLPGTTVLAVPPPRRAPRPGPAGPAAGSPVVAVEAVAAPAGRLRAPAGARAGGREVVEAPGPVG